MSLTCPNCRRDLSQDDVLTIGMHYRCPDCDYMDIGCVFVNGKGLMYQGDRR